jgi:hypothetical protein
MALPVQRKVAVEINGLTVGIGKFTSDGLRDRFRAAECSGGRQRVLRGWRTQ